MYLLEFRSGSGSGTLDQQSHSSYVGTGTYGYGDLSGAITESGQHHSQFHGITTTKVSASGWETTGDGTSVVSGNASASYSGSGTYSRPIPGGTINGSQAESGHQQSEYSYEAGWKLSPTEFWMLDSGSGHYSGSGEYAFSSSGSGTYTKTFDGDGILSGTAEESREQDASFEFRYDSEVIEGRWSTSGSGSSSGSTAYQFEYSGAGVRSITTTTSQGSREDTSTLVEVGAEGFSNQFTTDWEWDADGLTWSAVSTSSSTGAGAYAYSGSGSGVYTYTSGNYAGGGNGSIWTNSDSYSRSKSENFEWDSVRVEHEEFADGVTTRWSNETGDGSASGSIYSRHETIWTLQSRTTTSNQVTEETKTTSNGREMSDGYSSTYNWTKDVATDGAVTYNAVVENDVSGSGQMWYSFSNAWTTTYTGGSSSGSGSGSYTTSGGTSNGNTTPLQPYALALNRVAFYDGAYNRDAAVWWMAGLPVTTSGSYVTSGGSNGGGGGGGEGGESDVVQWSHLKRLETNEDPFGPTFVHSLSGGEVPFEFIAAIKQDLPVPPSPYDNWYEEQVGELIRSVVGDEALANASDFELLAGTTLFVTGAVTTVWAFCTAPAAAAMGAANGALMGGTISAVGNAVEQLKAGTPFDVGQAAQAALAGAVVGAVTGRSRYCCSPYCFAIRSWVCRC